MNAKEIIAYAMIFNQIAIENKDDPRVWRAIQQMDEAKQLLEKEVEVLNGKLREHECRTT